MATYDVHQLYNQLCEIIDDHYRFVDITESEAYEDFPCSLSFSAFDFEDDCFIEYEPVDSCDIPDSLTSTKFKPEEYCSHLVFTYNDIATLKCALDNVLEYFKECAKDSSTSRDEKNELREYSIRCRNLQAKFNQFFSFLK